VDNKKVPNSQRNSDLQQCQRTTNKTFRFWR